MRVAAVQLEAVVADVEANLAACERLGEAAAAEGAEVIALPEFFTTGIGFVPALAEAALPPDGAPTEVLRSIAMRHRALVGGSFLCRDADGEVRNAYLVVRPAHHVGERLLRGRLGRRRDRGRRRPHRGRRRLLGADAHTDGAPPARARRPRADGLRLVVRAAQLGARPADGPFREAQLRDRPPRGRGIRPLHRRAGRARGPRRPVVVRDAVVAASVRGPLRGRDRDLRRGRLGARLARLARGRGVRCRGGGAGAWARGGTGAARSRPPRGTTSASTGAGGTGATCTVPSRRSARARCPT